MQNIKISMAAARVNAGLTQEEIANKMKVSKQTIINWEKGRVIPRFAQLSIYCDIVGISSEYIFLPKN